jgi:D-sedoheptulose 7-phosphate isomerase
MFIPITTSGNSENLIEAVKIANHKGLKIVALTGATGGALNELCECIKVPSDSVPRIQECHILIGHLLCQIAEEGIFKLKS